MNLRLARQEDASVLTTLAQRSKAHWGYPPDLMEQFRAALTVSPAACTSGRMVVAEVGTTPIGFAAWLPGDASAELCDLWIDPDWMGQGAGRLLFDWVARACQDAGFDRLWCEADPHAVGFYERMGGHRTGEVESSSVTGRFLPRMEFALVSPSI